MLIEFYSRNAYKRELTSKNIIVIIYSMDLNVNREKCTIIKLHQDDSGFVKAGFAERLGMVWELTRQVWTFTGKDAEQRLQRDVAKLIRQ